MTLRHAAAALFALTAAGLSSAALAAPSCTITVMGLTFDNCATETPAVVANLAGETRARTSDAPRTDVTETGAVVRHRVAR